MFVIYVINYMLIWQSHLLTVSQLAVRWPCSTGDC